jgi:peptidyl-prolyl cis-trans isomerase C
MALRFLRPFVFGTAAALLLAPHMSFALDASKVVAKVNGKDVTIADLEKYKAENPQMRNLPTDVIIAPLREHAVNSILLDEAVKKSKTTTTKQFKERLEELKTVLARDLYLEQTVLGKISDATLKKMYDDEIKKLDGQTEMRARHILVKTQDEAKAIIKDLENGADFAKLATEKSTGPSKSQGGDLGYFGEGRMVPAFEAAVKKLKKGEFTKTPVQTQYGWHIIKLEDERPVQPPAFEDVKNQLKSAKAGEIMQQHLKELRDKAKVELVD